MTSEVDPGPEIDREVLERVLETHPVRLAVLFGSIADGTATSTSDVDIAVAFENAIPDRRHRARAALAADISEALDTDDVDVADLETVRPSVGAAALRSGILLVGDAEYASRLRDRLEGQTTTETREERLERFDDIIDRIEETVS